MPCFYTFRRASTVASTVASTERQLSVNCNAGLTLLARWTEWRLVKIPIGMCPGLKPMKTKPRRSAALPAGCHTHKLTHMPGSLYIWIHFHTTLSPKPSNPIDDSFSVDLSAVQDRYNVIPGRSRLWRASCIAPCAKIFQTMKLSKSKASWHNKSERRHSFICSQNNAYLVQLMSEILHHF